ncbi:hypothetical protein BDR07DRAFT_154435 [Suillus spraguei]|nr:hypothetical protein BDR07DRAFT_154435 [Suillus spraguei]
MNISTYSQQLNAIPYYTYRKHSRLHVNQLNFDVGDKFAFQLRKKLYQIRCLAGFTLFSLISALQASIGELVHTYVDLTSTICISDIYWSSRTLSCPPSGCCPFKLSLSFPYIRCRDSRELLKAVRVGTIISSQQPTL